MSVRRGDDVLADLDAARLMARMLVSVTPGFARGAVAMHTEMPLLAAALIGWLGDVGRLEPAVTACLPRSRRCDAGMVASWLQINAADLAVLCLQAEVATAFDLEPPGVGPFDDLTPAADRTIGGEGLVVDPLLDRLPLLDLAADMAVHRAGGTRLARVRLITGEAMFDGLWVPRTGEIIVAERLLDTPRQLGEVFSHELSHALDPELTRCVSPARAERFADTLGRYLLDAAPSTLDEVQPLITAALAVTRPMEWRTPELPPPGPASLVRFDWLFSFNPSSSGAGQVSAAAGVGAAAADAVTATFTAARPQSPYWKGQR